MTDQKPSQPAMHGAETPKPASRVVEIVRPSYQPSKAELEEDVRMSATFEEVVDALARPACIKYIDRPKRA